MGYFLSTENRGCQISDTVMAKQLHSYDGLLAEAQKKKSAH